MKRDKRNDIVQINKTSCDQWRYEVLKEKFILPFCPSQHYLVTIYNRKTHFQ